MRDNTTILRSPFLWKLYAGYVILILLTTGIVGFLVARRIEQDTLKEIERSLRAEATLLREVAVEVLGTTGEVSLQQRVAALGRRIGARLTVIRADGTVIADSEKNPAQMDNHGKRPEIVGARLAGEGTATRMSKTLEKHMMYLAQSVTRGGDLLGFVRVSLPLTVIHDRLTHLRRLVALGAVIAATIALLLGFGVAHRVTSPLASMTSAAESIAAGNYDERVRESGRDELSKLARAFNSMAAELQARLETITSDRNKVIAILAGMVEGLIAVDRRERVVHLNRAAATLLGTEAETSAGKPIWEVTRTHEVSRTMAEVLSSETEVSGEFHMTSGPQEKIIEMHASPLRDGQGRLAGAVLVMHDVSELRRLEVVRRDFVANVSHELKTPTTAIRGMVETLLDDREMPVETRTHFLHKILNQSLRLSALLTDLLALSRLESREPLPERAPVDLSKVVAESLKGLHGAAEDKAIKITADLPDGPLPISGDEEALRQAVVNLLDNAIKYTPEGGRVKIKAGLTGGEIRVEVADTGVGIEAKHLDRIFERFYRVDKGRSRELGGTGLGLSIVKHAALAHGGTVSVESTPGKGSTFRLVLPADLA